MQEQIQMSVVFHNNNNNNEFRPKLRNYSEVLDGRPENETC